MPMLSRNLFFAVGGVVVRSKYQIKLRLKQNTSNEVYLKKVDMSAHQGLNAEKNDKILAARKNICSISSYITLYCLKDSDKNV